MPPEQRLNPFANAVGTPDEVRKVMLEYEAAGVDQMILIVQFGKVPHEYVCDSLELFGKEVLPDIHGAPGEAGKRKGRPAGAGD